VKREDSPKEASYRQLVRASLAGDPKRDLNPMRATGEKLGLNETEVQRIITQEIERTQGLSQYEAMVAQMVADGVLTKDKRQALNSFYPTLNMTQADARSVERKFKFSEEGVAPPAAAASKPTPAQPAAPNPKTVPAPGAGPKAAGTAAPSPKAPVPSTTKAPVASQ
jgi:hypothetical protein